MDCAPCVLVVSSIAAGFGVPVVSAPKIAAADGRAHLTHVGCRCNARFHVCREGGKRRFGCGFLTSFDHKFEPCYRQRQLIWQYARESCENEGRAVDLCRQCLHFQNRI
jgi:hypothetical protein